jgi:hypothetical protein
MVYLLQMVDLSMAMLVTTRWYITSIPEAAGPTAPGAQGRSVRFASSLVSECLGDFLWMVKRNSLGIRKDYRG